MTDTEWSNVLLCGTKFHKDTVDSLPFANFTWAYSGFTSKRSTSYTNGSYMPCLLRCLSNTVSGVLSQLGTAFPDFKWHW